MRKIPYEPNRLQDFDREWNLHIGCKEWWCCTGVLRSDHGLSYSYQFTLLTADLRLFAPKVLLLALTDLQTGKHHSFQQTSLLGAGVEMGESRLRFGGRAEVMKTGEGIRLVLRHEAFSLDLNLGYGRGACWHCDHGKLYMGTPGDEKQTTFYFSYPDMPTAGYLTVEEETMPVTGATWFDRQGGTYAMIRPQTHWEWFSFRFDDGDRLMLFTFPQRGYADGTLMPAGQPESRLRDFTVRPTRTAEAAGLAWSAAWEVELPGVKAGRYAVTPLFNGNIRFACYEELCAVTDPQGNRVGLCFVALLPGVRNPGSRIDARNLFRTVEY